MRVVNQAHGLSPDGCRYFGLLQIAATEVSWSRPQPPTPDYTYVLGLRNSHDKRFPAAMVLGSQVFVCDNLAFSGEIKIERKHTRFIERDLPSLVGTGVSQLAERWHQQDARFAAYKQTELSPARRTTSSFVRWIATLSRRHSFPPCSPSGARPTIRSLLSRAQSGGYSTQ